MHVCFHSIVLEISVPESVSLIVIVERVEGRHRSCSNEHSREIPKNGSGPRNWGNPKDVKEQLFCRVAMVIRRSDETQEVEKSPVEEVEEKPEEPKPVVYTLEEYEAQRKAKMSSLIGKKTPRAVEAPVTEKIERVEEDYFVVGAGGGGDE